MVLSDGSVGIVDSLDGEWADVRMLTPKNVPSEFVVTCYTEHLIAAGDNVVPMPRSQEWINAVRQAGWFLEGAAYIREDTEGEAKDE